jgi:hypothetical protein
MTLKYKHLSIEINDLTRTDRCEIQIKMTRQHAQCNYLLHATNDLLHNFKHEHE